MASPMPCPAPVTIAILSLRRSVMASPVNDRAVGQHGVSRMKDFLLERMLRDFTLVHVDPQSRLLGEIPAAGAALYRPLHDVAIPRNRAGHLFLNHEVRRGYSEMKSGHARDRAERIMWRDPD